MRFPVIRRTLLVGLLAGLFAEAGFAQDLSPRFAGARVNGTHFVMELVGIGDLCVLEAADELSAQWTEVALAGPLGDGEIDVPVDRPKQFFRIRCGDEYSTNSAGYVALELTPGWHLIANPFDNGGNTLPEVLGEDWPFGMAIYQFDALDQAFTATHFGRSAWLSDVQRLSPGAGAFIEVVASSTLILGGLFDNFPTVPEPLGGWNLVGSTPDASAIIPEEGDLVAIWTREGYFTLHSFEFGEWGNPLPSTELGEGFWYSRARLGAEPPAGGCVLFGNFGPTIGFEFGAPQFDHIGCPIEGTNWLAQIYAGPTAEALVAVGEPVTFLSGDEAGYFNTGSNAVRYIESVPPGSMATLQIRMWMASRGATFEAAMANGAPNISSSTFTVTTGGAGSPPGLPANLVGLTATSGLGSIVPDVTGGGSYFVGGSAQFTATHDYVTSRTVTYQWQRGGSPDIWSDWVNVDGATESVLKLSPLSFADADHYRVRIIIEGCFGGGVSFPVELKVLATPSFSSPSIDPVTGTLRFVLNAEPTFDYAIEYSSDFVHWSMLTTALKPVGPVEIMDSGAPEIQQRFYRARVLLAP